MEHESALKCVTEMANLAESYVSAWGTETQVSDASLYQLLAALGYDVRNEQSLLASAKKKHKKSVLPPVTVIRDGESLDIALHLGVSARESEFIWQVDTEQGDRFEGHLPSYIVSDMRSDGGALVFRLPLELPWGYHKLTLQRKRRKTPYVMTLIIAPNRCYVQPELDQNGKLWGPSIQLYTLRSQHNWGIGDFGDLKELICELASRGAGFVGLNPVHSLFPSNPEAASPYSPSSRRWLNLLYIDVCAVPEFALNIDAQQLVGSSDFQRRLQEARDTHWVDYTKVASLKFSVLPLLFEDFKSRHLNKRTHRGANFLTFVEQGGESLRQQAAFDALHRKLSDEQENVWGWPVFPDEYRRYENVATQAFIEQNPDDIAFFMYLQWVADGQINEAQNLAKEKGMVLGLYRDLAVGVSDAGCETWSDDSRLVKEASIGAPPDVLGPLGQNWGLPPFDPHALQQSGYNDYVALVRANMKHCGALRIDHVMGILRLWLIPKGKNASEGAYLYYPVNDLLAILALESHRAQCTVIGEDLGTVPAEIVSLLRDAGILSYKVFFFETSFEDGGYISPAHYSPQSMATLCTHDMPTMRGFWHCDDLKMGHELGLYPDEDQLKPLFDERLRQKQGVLNSVRWHGFLTEGVGEDAQFVPMDGYLSRSLQLHVASGQSALFSVQLEDWLEMDKPVNIPGTVDEYPNWRRKLSMNIEAVFSQPEIGQLMRDLTRVRQAASR